MQMFFSNNRNENIGGQQSQFFVMFDLIDTAVFIYFPCEGNLMKIVSLNEKFCSVRIFFTNVTLPSCHILSVF